LPSASVGPKTRRELFECSELFESVSKNLEANMLIPLLLADASEPGLLDINIMSDIWILIIFTILVLILYKTAWKNVLAGLKARETRIRKDIADAEATRKKAEQLLVDYNAKIADAEQRVRDILVQAGTDAEKIGTNVRMKAQQDAEEAKERATKEIEAAKRTALAEIYQQTAELATSVAEKIIKRNLKAEDQRDLVNESLDKLKTVGRN
jgi:F-type H+-transporting ATPase subunit b